ncbi:DUF3667 domain-containing protein [Erythrobacter sp. EC-HK427]|uniref:DUF3667 domain-containing protein n=1 Tax=Erythrobacter sp. EC-HK427 TaxID=2038396 RepID=UPI001253F523|nr:DUF3667 domain-containing protein [Erythrobacter sp. EC-HK427]VVS99913.1 conserved membrane hypothetical protein [Erythrobacter sp. EC-HK427]
MNDLFDGIGSATQGGLFARALEPDSGAKAPHPDQPEQCLNCGTALTGAYCHSCGQKGHLHRTIGAFMHDLVHGAFHFEGKFWRTLPMLLFKPGALTRRYIDGERARFVSPMALFLFSVFLMFAVFQMLGLTTPTDLNSSGISSSMDTLQTAAQDDLDDARSRMAASEAGTPAHAEAEREAAAAQEALDGLAQARVLDFEDNPDVTIFGIESLDEGIVAKWRDNPGLMLYKLQANAYKFSWLLIPISIPFLWLLLFWKRRFKAYDHAIFVTYSLSFMTILFIAASLLIAARLDAGLVVITTMLVPPIHLYKQLRYAYDLSRFGTFWRLMVLSIFIWIIILLFVQLLLLLGAF